MKKLISALLIVAMVLAMAAPAMAASKVYTSGSANLRKGPSLDYAIICTVKKGATLTYKNETKTDSRGVKWYKVSYNGKTGWISSKYSSFEKSGSKPKTSSKDKVTATGSVNLRKGPGLKYDIVATVDKGAELKYLGDTKTDSRGVKWYKVSYNGGTAWISSKYSKNSKSSGSSLPKPSTSAKNKVTTTGEVNLRKGPGLKYGKVATLAKGATLKYLGSTSKDSRGVKWYKVSYDGKTAWISSKYSKLKTSSSSSSSSSSSAKSSADTASTEPAGAVSDSVTAKETVAPDGEVPSSPSAFPDLTDDTVAKAPIVTAAPTNYVEISGFYQAKLIETAIMLQIDDFQKTDSEVPNQYSNDALTIAGDTNVEYMRIRGEGYTIYGVCVNMDVETAKGLLTAAGLVQVDRDWVIGFEHPAADGDGYDSCVNLYSDTEGRITELDWSTYTN